MDIRDVAQGHVTTLQSTSELLLHIGQVSERVAAAANQIYHQLQSLTQILPKVAQCYTPNSSSSKNYVKLRRLLQTLNDELSGVRKLATNAPALTCTCDADENDDDGYEELRGHCERIDLLENSFRQYLLECAGPGPTKPPRMPSTAMIRKTKQLPWNTHAGRPFQSTGLGSIYLLPVYILMGIRKGLDPLRLQHESLRKAAKNMSAMALCGLGMYYAGVLGRVEDGLYFTKMSLSKLEGKRSIQRAYVLHIAAELSSDFQECKRWFREAKDILECLPQTEWKETWTTLHHWVTSRLVVYLIKGGNWDEATRIMNNLLARISRRAREPLTEVMWKRYVREGTPFFHGRQNTMFQISRSLYKMGNFLACEELLSAFVQIVPQTHVNRNSAQHKRACCLIRLGRTPEAEAILEDLDPAFRLEKKGVEAEARFALACKYIYDGQLADAASILDVLDPGFRRRYEYHNALCHAILEMHKAGCYHDARDAIRDEEVFLNIRSARHKGWILPTLLWATLMALGEHQEAADWSAKSLPIFLEKFGRSHWRYTDALNNRAKALAELGDTEAAIAELTKVVDVLKELGNIADDVQCYQRWRCINRLSALAARFVDRSEYDKAISILAQIHELKPGAKTCACPGETHYSDRISRKARELRRVLKKPAFLEIPTQYEDDTLNSGCSSGGFLMSPDPGRSPFGFSQMRSQHP